MDDDCRLRGRLGVFATAGILPRRTQSDKPAPPKKAASDASPSRQDEQGRAPETAKAEDPPVAADTATKPAAADSPASKQREPLFQGWPNPRMALFITGRLNGYFEPCGCTGLTNQKGGLARRASLVRQLTESGWPLVAIDAGNQVRRHGPQAEIKFQVTVDGLKKLNYRAIALGPDDLQLSAGVLVAVAAGDGGQPSPFVSANVVVLDPDLTPRYVVASAGGKKVGVTSVLGESHRKQVSSNDVTIRSPAEVLAEVWPRLEQEGCDLYVLIADAELDESMELGRKFPGFALVTTTGGAAEPTYQPETIPGGDAMFTQVGAKGMYAIVIGVFDDKEKPLRYQRVPLDDRFPDSREMLALLANYQSQLETLGFERLGLQPIPHPSGRTFVGSKACGECHKKAYAVWKETSHAHAIDSLVHPGERSEIPRHFDPECIGCHVVGWSPQKYFPYTSGYLGLEASPEMHGVGCEDCHGPGSAHTAAEQADVKVSDEELKKLRESVRLPLKEAEENCIQCHDLDNSIEFQKPGAFLKYWAKIQHEGMD